MAFTRPDLLVPAAALEAARAVLSEAWGEIEEETEEG
jgi:hypothetical protein